MIKKSGQSVSTIVLGAILSTTLLSACTGTRPVDIGVTDNRLISCPDSPNCVSSFEKADDETHYIAPFRIKGDDQVAVWSALQTLIEQNSSAEIIKKDDDYIYAEYTSGIMKFVDDTEFLLNKQENSVHLRSASRLGYKDFGVNRDRIESIRSELQTQNIIE